MVVLFVDRDSAKSLLDDFMITKEYKIDGSSSLSCHFFVVSIC